MRDCLIIAPTRRRLANAQRLIDSVAATATMKTDLILAVDEDDEQTYAGKLRLAPNVRVVMGPRRTVPEWTNRIALGPGREYWAVASLGDDHVPETPGWDADLMGAIDAMGGAGIAYGNDTLQGVNLPTAPVVSSGIVAALGWFMYPFGHFFCDNVWKDLGEQAGCLVYLPNVIIRHYHCAFGTAPVDSTYAEAAPAWLADEPAYHAWRDGDMAADVEKVRALCQRGQS
jgi:hypothetical protein